MKHTRKTLICAVLAALPGFAPGFIPGLAPGFALADADENTLTINGDVEMTTKAEVPDFMSETGFDQVISGWHFRSADTQALEMDDFDNPSFVFIDQAKEDWAKVEGTEGKSCESCHKDVAESMKGVRATYPKWNDASEEVRTLAMQINSCRQNNMKAEPLDYTSDQMVRMEALIGLQSRGMPMNVKIDGPAQAMWEKGQEMYYTRFGELDLSCANCHEQNYGRMIRADHLSQGQTNGFPVYRLKNTKLNAVQDRFKGCIRDTRAETFSPGSPEFVALELYVASRGNGLSVETPAVRN